MTGVRWQDLRVGVPNLVPAMAIGAVAISSFANLQLQITRSILLALLAAGTMLLLRTSELPLQRPGLQLAASLLVAWFVIALIRIVVARPIATESLSIISTTIGSAACWFLGATAMIRARDRERVLVAIGGMVPLCGVVALVVAFQRGVLPETNYWQFVEEAGPTAKGIGTREYFALSEDVLSLLAFYVGAIPFLLRIRRAGLRFATLLGATGALALLVLNGSLTFPVTALMTCLVGMLLGVGRGIGAPRAMRAMRGVALLLAIVLGLGGAAYVILTNPRYGAPLLASLGNKDPSAGRDVLDGRDVMWGKAVEHVAESPLIGHPLDERVTEETRYAYNNPHNDLLLAALKFGVPAALLLVGAVLAVGWRFVRSARAAASYTTRSAALLGFAAWAGLWLPPLYAGWLSSPFYSNLALAGISGLCFTGVRLGTEGARRA